MKTGDRVWCGHGLCRVTALWGTYVEVEDSRGQRWNLTAWEVERAVA